MGEYTADKEVLAKLNKRAHEICEEVGRCEIGRLQALYDERRELNETAKEYGFIRIFDGSFKLNLAKYGKA